MEYKIGDKVIIKDLNWYENHKDKPCRILENHGEDVFQDWIKEYGGKKAIIIDITPDSPQYKLEIPNFENGFTHFISLDEDYLYKPSIERIGNFLMIYDYDCYLKKQTDKRYLISIDNISYIYETPKETNLISIQTKIVTLHVDATLDEVIKLLKQK